MTITNALTAINGTVKAFSNRTRRICDVRRREDVRSEKDHRNTWHRSQNKRIHLLNILQLVISPLFDSSRPWNFHWDLHDQNHLHKHANILKNKMTVTTHETNNRNIVYQRNVHLARNRLGCKMATAFVTSNPACTQKKVKWDNITTKGKKSYSSQL